MDINTEIIIGVSVISLILLLIILRSILRKKGKALSHHAPTNSVLKKKGKGYIDGVYHCEPCGVAGHLFTLGANPCYKCGQKMGKYIAKWSSIKGIWEFKK